MTATQEPAGLAPADPFGPDATGHFGPYGGRFVPEALTAALDELYGLGYRHSESEDELYEAVTTEQVVAVARKYLTPGAMVISIIQPG